MDDPEKLRKMVWGCKVMTLWVKWFHKGIYFLRDWQLLNLCAMVFHQMRERYEIRGTWKQDLKLWAVAFHSRRLNKASTRTRFSDQTVHRTCSRFAQDAEVEGIVFVDTACHWHVHLLHELISASSGWMTMLSQRPLPPAKYSALRHGTCWLAPHRWHRGECHGVAQQFSGGSLGGRESIAWGWQVDTFDTFRRSNPATRGWLWSWGDGWKGSKIDATLLFLQSKWVKYRETILVLSKCCPEGSAACGWVGDPDGISPGDLDGRAWRAKPIAEVWQPG